MTTHDALGEYFARRGIKPDDESVDEWLRENWAYMKIFGHRVPVKPLYGYKKVLILHDTHHLVAGYDTTWTGEDVAGILPRPETPQPVSLRLPGGPGA